MKLNFKSVYAWTQRYISMTFIIVVAFVCIVLFFNENSVLMSLVSRWDAKTITCSAPTKMYSL